MMKIWSYKLLPEATVASTLSASLLSVERPWLPAGLQGQNIGALEFRPSGYIPPGTAILDAKTMYRGTDFDVTWSEPSDLPSGSQIWDIEIDPTDELIVYAGLNGAGVFTSVDGGANWTWSMHDSNMRRAQ